MDIVPTVKSYILKKVMQKYPHFYWYNAKKKISLDKIRPFSTYAKQVISEKRCMLKEDRLYTIYQACKDIPDGLSTVEIGVYKGGGSKFISQVIGNNCSHYACDTFSGHAQVDKALDGLHKVNDGFSDTSYISVSNYLSDMKNIKIICGDIASVYGEIPGSGIFFLHADVDVYPATKFILEKFWKGIVVGGAIVVDDYGFTSCKGVKVAVDEFLKGVDNCFFMHLLTGQCLIVKTHDDL